MTKIINGSDKALEERFKDHRDRIARMPDRIKSLPKWNGNTTPKDPVTARIDFGRWVADCHCGGAEYVDFSDPIFFCFSCGNKAHNGSARRVIFPDATDIADIENALLERPVIERAGLSDSARSLHSVPALAGLSRSWNPGETIEDLKAQHSKAIARAKVK